MRLGRNRQQGSALVIVMLVLTAISILGVLSINISSVETEIARNEREMRELFYLSESGAAEGVQRLVETPGIDLEEKIAPWHHSFKSVRTEGMNFRETDHWDTDGQGEDNAMQTSLDPDTYFVAVERRLASGSSAVLTEPRLYMNQVFGLSTKYKAANIIEIGYYLRY